MPQRLLAVLTVVVLIPPARAADKPPFPYVWGRAHHVLPETTSDESGYFSLCEGRDHKIYVGTAKYGVNSFLVEFDPKTGKQRIVLDTNKVCGLKATGYAAQAKLHTRNFVGPSGKIYVGSKQGYRRGNDKSEYPGGYVMVYDPATGKSENLGMPYKGQGVIDVVADEPRGLMYVVTCEDQHWMLYDIKAKKYRELGPLLTPYATTLVDAKGRANTITRDNKLARYDPATGKVTIHDVLLDGASMTKVPKNPIPTWNLAADGRTAYMLFMSDARLMRIDLGGDTVKATRLGTMIAGDHPDSRSALSIAPDGRVYAVIRVDNKTGFGTGYLHHLTRYDPKTGRMADLGVLAVKNPTFYDFGAKRPWSHGYHKLPDGTLTPLHAHMAMIVAHDGTVYVTIIYPFTLLKIDPLPAAPAKDATGIRKRIAPYFRPPAEYARDLGGYKSPLVFDDGTRVKSAKDWSRRRAEILKYWHGLMGPWPALLPKPKAEYLAKERREDFTQHRLRLEVAPGLTRDGYLLVPDGKGPFPAVLVVFYDPETGIGRRGKLRDFAYQLTKRGFVTLSLGSDPLTYYPTKKNARLQPLSFHAYVAANCHTFLASLPEVDAHRIGVTGHSYGGKWAMFASCLYDKFACAAWSDPGIVFDEKRSNVNYWEPWYLGYESGRERKRGVVTATNPRTGPYKRMVAEGHDLHELHALMAPRPFLVSGGSEDQPERWRALNHSVAVNRLLGFTDRVAMHNRKGHDPTAESNEVLYRFFEYFLKHGKAPAAP